MMDQKNQQQAVFRKAVFVLCRVVVFLSLTALGCSAPVLAQTQSNENTPASPTNAEVEAQTPVAPVKIDGNILFSVRGFPAISAEDRATAIAERIKAVARDSSIPTSSISPLESELGTSILAGNQRLMVVFDADAQQTSVPRGALAQYIVSRIQSAVTDYRQARTRQALSISAARAGVGTVILVAFVAMLIWLSRRLLGMLEKRYRQRIHSVGIQSFEVVRAEQIWNAFQRLIHGGRLLLILAICVIYLNYVLGQFPWTRETANQMSGYVIRPLETLGKGAVGHIPSIIFLVILFLITRFTLKLIHKFFDAVSSGDVKISGFDPDWSESTYKLIRLAVVVLALVVAYPYIPGGRSEAFKGITIFMGLVFSLGSSSAIANLIAGYTMTYRRAFRVGDRVKIGDIIGDVTEMRLQVTHLKTVKNEEVTIPNSQILNNEVMNYSSLARQQGLILHTTVGIGYETPWRQVEAMLLIAAERTPGILKEPPPFVLQKALGDFAVTYEINVYCDNPQTMGRVYSALHSNVLDLFNEYGVQIMTPSYEGDPKLPKVVPKEQWFNAPAKA
ncbi:MAG: mechanosensitive ion channel family protein [Pyrinomonadaceae bacterium]